MSEDMMEGRRGAALWHAVSRYRYLLLLGSLVAVMVGLALVLIPMAQQNAATQPTRRTGSPVPADLFMQSVVKRDADLGWHQLCPALQAQLPLEMLRQQTAEQRATETKLGVTLSMDYIGTRPQASGGEVRLYLLTGHRRDGLVGQRIYAIQTQASGCVEDVQEIDLGQGAA